MNIHDYKKERWLAGEVVDHVGNLSIYGSPGFLGV